MSFGERLKQAREFRGLTQSDLAAEIGINQSTIAYVESGRFTPRDELTTAIALRTGFPPAFFHEAPVGDFPVGSLLFRSRASVTSRDERRAYRYAQLGYEILVKLLRRVKSLPVRIPSLDDDPETAAQAARMAFGLSPDRPIPHLTNTLERNGCLVLRLPIHPDGIDAFSVWTTSSPERPVIIATAPDEGATDGARDRLSMGHELGHLVMHRMLTGDLSRMEKEAYRFAQEFLLPEAAMREEMVPPLTLPFLAGLKGRWGVSIAALVKRAADLGVVNDRQKKYLFQQIRQQGWRIREPQNLDVATEQPQALRQLAERFYGRPLDYEKLATDMRLSVRVVRDFFETSSPRDPTTREGQIVQMRQSPAS